MLEMQTSLIRRGQYAWNSTGDCRLVCKYHLEEACSLSGDGQWQKGTTDTSQRASGVLSRLEYSAEIDAVFRFLGMLGPRGCLTSVCAS